jgi:hypothetical protein
MRTLSVATIALMSIVSHVQAEQYLCITEHAAGVHYMAATKTWEPTIYTTGSKYVLRHLNGDERQAKYPDNNPQGYTILSSQSNDPSKSEWGFFYFGEKLPRSTCDAHFRCTDSFLLLSFDSRTLRFETYQRSGYVYTPLMEKPGSMGNTPQEESARIQAVNHPDTGSISIGECSAF